jgi:hypothetical protein
MPLMMWRRLIFGDVESLEDVIFFVSGETVLSRFVSQRPKKASRLEVSRSAWRVRSRPASVVWSGHHRLGSNLGILSQRPSSSSFSPPQLAIRYDRSHLLRQVALTRI